MLRLHACRAEQDKSEHKLYLPKRHLKLEIGRGLKQRRAQVWKDEGNRETYGFGFISFMFFMSFISHESPQQPSCFSEDMLVVVPVVFA